MSAGATAASGPAPFVLTVGSVEIDLGAAGVGGAGGIVVALLLVFLCNTKRGDKRLAPSALCGFLCTVSGVAVPILHRCGIPVSPRPDIVPPEAVAAGAPVLVLLLFVLGAFDESPPEPELTYGADDLGAEPVAARGSDWPCTAGCDKRVHAALEAKRAAAGGNKDEPGLPPASFKETHYQSPLPLGRGGLVVDLDLPPDKRWAHIAGDPEFAKELNTVLDCLFTRFLQKHIAITLPGRLYALLRHLTLRLLPPAGYGIRNINRMLCARAGIYDAAQTAGPLESLFGAEYAAEMRGLAAAAGLDLADVLAANGVYELGGGCTSIVAEMPDGSMVHGRNFDYAEQYIRSVIVSVSFQRQGAELYRGSLILPIIGVVDGMRPGVCSVSVNTRHKNAQQQPIGAKAAIYSSFEGGMVKMLRRNWDSFLLGNFGGSEFAPAGSQPTTVSHLLRKTLETTHSFGAAVRTLSTVPQGGLSYIAVAGTKKGEGAVITRSRRCAADVRTLFDYGDGATRWALVQTNHDHWLVDPVPAADGGFGSDRAGPAMERMGLARPGVIAPVSAEDPEGALRDYRESMSAETMWGVIGSMPNFTFTGKTLLSAVMIPATGLCDVRYQVGLGTNDEYFWVCGGRGDPSTRSSPSSSASAASSSSSNRSKGSGAAAMQTTAATAATIAAAPAAEEPLLKARLRSASKP